jgi:hypothetical protein
MPRSRVMSFMTQWGTPSRSGTPDIKPQMSEDPFSGNPARPSKIDTALASATNKTFDASGSPSPTTQQRFRSDSRTERGSRPMSMVYTHQPPIMDLAHDTLPELQPIFTYLNSHSNKLYQEGYFLKLHDLDSREQTPGKVLMDTLLTTSQVDAQVQIEHGQSVSLSWSAQYSRYGMLRHWTLRVKTVRSCLHSSMSATLQSRW